jgi:EmrB/QacA subfamily drug resistance transporter
MSSTPRTSPALVLFVTTVSAFCTSFAASSVNVALPLIGTEFHLGGVALNWVVTAFVLVSAVLVMPLGRLGDLHGRQLIFAWGMVVYTVGSVLGALALGPAWLIGSRAMTGVGAAMAFGTVTAVLVAAYPPEQRGRILGINVAMVYFGLSAGPVFGGLITQALGWRSLFWVHALLALVVVVLVFWKLRGNDRQHHHGGFDFAGSLLYAAGLALLLTGFSDLPQVLGVVLTVAGLAVLAGFWIYEGRAASPILPVTLFTQNHTFAFSNLAAMISYSATFAVAFFLSLYLEVVRGLSPGQAGLLLIAQPLVQAVFSPLTGRLSDKISPRLLASLGMALCAAGLAFLALLDSSTPLGFVLGALVLLGLGFALFSSPNTNSIMGSVEKKDLGLASATLATMRVVGQMLSMGLALVLLSLILGKASVEPATAQLFLAAQRGGFGISAALCALGILASLARGKQNS